MVEKFSSKLKALGIIVRELTGDMQLSRAEAEAAHVSYVMSLDIRSLANFVAVSGQTLPFIIRAQSLDSSDDT